ncbi:hypothetical protein NDU88_009757 [Pleurodeles waltl]|uniref:Uncharacterized protein n=1 Tax=Pleurodeles waltl TaxID=8319 RepID=A0AAV7Q0A3_PLEWA|nr:hypothetical protein NDU88_009757 [Pleurodeles waltl]
MEETTAVNEESQREDRHSGMPRLADNDQSEFEREDSGSEAEECTWYEDWWDPPAHVKSPTTTQESCGILGFSKQDSMDYDTTQHHIITHHSL